MDQDIAQFAERRVPRYTSYPTAPHFSAASDDNAHRQWLADLNPADPLSLYLHVPFCKKVCWYCACNMKLAARIEPVLVYGDHVQKEIDLVADILPARMTANHIHWGGGTPTAMPIPALKAIMAKLRQRIDIAPNAEIAFELDPRTFEPEMAEGLAEMGATRASLGVQEFDAKVQETVNRIQPYETVKATVDSLRAAGVKGINFDLMYGLPHQSVETLKRSIELTLKLAPDRIALFGYAHVPWMAKRQRQISEDTLPNTSSRFEQAERAADALITAGYERIGLDHFAKPDDNMAIAARNGTLKRNFQGYTVDDGTTLLGLGATSISSLPEAYAQNILETGAYQRAVATGLLPTAKTCALTADDKLRRDLIERLMCDGSVDIDTVCQRHSANTQQFADALAECQSFEKQGLVKLNGWQIAITEKGRPALRVVAALFDAYLAKQQPQTQRHAQAV